MTAAFEWAIRSVPDDPSNQDRAVVFEADGGLVLILADGAGGMAGGRMAAQAVADRARAWVEGRACLPDAVSWANWLRTLDGFMADEPFMGQTTAVCVSVSPETVAGACVGDSEAWLVGSGRCTDLTAERKRKPLLGNGQAVPVAFGAPLRDECVVVGSDGLCRFVG
ncbi:MAG: hypothetical protein FJX72_21680, partial [Armatimonadetes bacterium]|nr:hypothetical protein [Armatimonadota bacterium]